ncbi:HEPN-associated N-terminal domain-containing protein [Geothrix edaphica]|uniref:RES domain-containing protein n=1 Tax=Geothrix edaphica TaxID=2927976 RepID=A0ABQ5PUE7_9BACT|nr:HEPN-associated N-terminal domain-containing protein [Geothrix edaphica]GLH65987.1 hypothetical protein GETHED_03510 [Geothrix edaphica]
MGTAKAWQMEQEDRGYYGIGTNFCKNCVDDANVIKFIKNSGLIHTTDQCSYCNITKKVWSTDDLMDTLASKIFEEWGDLHDGRVPYDDETGDPIGNEHSFSTEELLEHEGFLVSSTQLQEDIQNAFIATEWCENDPFGDNEELTLKISWNEFSNIVKHKMRYTFFRNTNQADSYVYTPLELLNNMKRIFMFKGMLQTISAGATIFRARPGFGHNGGKALGTPPIGYGGANRMSPEGIGMFYGAFDEETCFKELFDYKKPKKNHCSIGQFITTCDLKVLDLTKYHNSSVLNENNKEKREILRFLNHFQKEISKPLSSKNSQIDYIPTQVLTEFIRYNLISKKGHGIDGIKYRSSKNYGHNCVVLFVMHEECGNKSDVNTKLNLVSASNRRVGP